MLAGVEEAGEDGEESGLLGGQLWAPLLAHLQGGAGAAHGRGAGQFLTFSILTLGWPACAAAP